MNSTNKSDRAVHEIRAGMTTAFIDGKVASNLAFKPSFVSNDYTTGNKVISSLEEELSMCQSFIISVAFITRDGIEPLLQVLLELSEKGVPGKILTTDYLMFNDPVALDKLHELKNIDLRMYRTKDQSAGFHTKGYIFRQNGYNVILIGSSNMTDRALTINREWNSRIVSTDDGEFYKTLMAEFESLWNAKQTETYDTFIETYREEYKVVQEQKRRVAATKIPSIPAYTLHPNAMQLAFIKNLRALYDTGKKRGLLVSATGTGKTYAAAFGMRDVVKPHRLLFIVHRELIAKQAKGSFERVFGPSAKCGLLSGNDKDFDAPFLFATMQTMAKPEVLRRFTPSYFDTIIIDEVHRAGAESYQRIVSYFRPRFLLGMTASPERTDGYDIFKLFDHNIVYEIRLQQAMENDLLCPFHYFGISDLELDGYIAGDIDEKKMTEAEKLRNFRYLTSDERVRHILDKAAYFGHSGDRVKGLIFCSRQTEAMELSKKFNASGLHTVTLFGNVSEGYREECIRRLTTDGSTDQLDYIFTIDIFNEGVDIPEINQVIMLRPTESPIIFVQQLGRGLRKAENKHFVVILDFIGNYQNNFMIPIALSGDRSYNKDTIRRYVREGSRVIPGSSTIHFDAISRQRIYQSIDQAKTNTLSLLRDAYQQLKQKLNRIPTIQDFGDYGSIDVKKYFDYAGSYYSFLVKYEKEYTVRFSKDKETMLQFVSKKLTSGKRIEELLLLEDLIENSFPAVHGQYDVAYDGKIDRNAAESTSDYESSQYRLASSQLMNKMDLRLIHGALSGKAIPETSDQNTETLMPRYEKELLTRYDIKMNDQLRNTVISVLTNTFPKNEEQKKSAACVCIAKGEHGEWKIAPAFEGMLRDPNFRQMLLDVVRYGISEFEKHYRNRYRDSDFVLYQKYTYEDVCRLLNWKQNMNAQNLGGYFYNAYTKTLPVFINYVKTEDAIAYEDRFIAPDELIALSKHPRRIDSSDADHFYKRTPADQDNRIYLFVRKNKDDQEANEFYFLGEVTAIGEPKPVTMPVVKKDGTKSTDSAFEILYKLDVPVRNDIYDYITEG